MPLFFMFSSECGSHAQQHENSQNKHPRRATYFAAFSATLVSSFICSCLRSTASRTCCCLYISTVASSATSTICVASLAASLAMVVVAWLVSIVLFIMASSCGFVWNMALWMKPPPQAVALPGRPDSQRLEGWLTTLKTGNSWMSA